MVQQNNNSNIFSSKGLIYFVELTKTMSYTKTAQNLGITQPALTQQIKKIESEIGTPLFYSTGKQIQLTDAGNTLLKATNKIFCVIKTTKNKIQESTEPTSGIISIGVLASLEDSVLEDFCSYYYGKFHDITIRVSLLTRGDIWQKLENDDIDVAMMYLPDKNIKNWQQYDSKKIVNDRIFFLHNDDKLAKQESVNLQDTLGKPWSSYLENYYLSELIAEYFKNNNIDIPQSAARFSTPHQVLKFAQDADIYAALPESFIIANKKSIEYYASEFNPNISADLSFVYRNEKIKIPRIKTFFENWDQFISEESYEDRLKNTQII